MSKSELDNLCRNIYILRKKHRLCQKEMAAIMGMGVGMLRRIEHGEISRRFHTGHLEALHRHFGISLDVLFCEDLGKLL